MGAGKGDRVRVSFRVRSSTLGLGRSISQLGSLAPLAAVSFLYFLQNTHAHTHTRRVTHLFTHTFSRFAVCWQCAPGYHCCCCFFFVLITSFVVVTACCCCCRLLGTTGIINNGWGEPTPRRAKLAYSLPLFMNEEGVLARSYSHSHSQSSLLNVINNCINATAFADKLSIIHLAISHPHSFALVSSIRYV